MSGTRLNLDLFFKDMTPQEVNKAFPNLLPAIKAAKVGASKINAGQENEEVTIRAVYHTCRNDIHQPCGEDIEI